MSALGQQRTSQVCKQKDRLTGGLSEIQFVSGHTASAAAFFFRRQPSRPLRQQGPAQQHASAFDRVRRALRIWGCVRLAQSSASWPAVPAKGRPKRRQEPPSKEWRFQGQNAQPLCRSLITPQLLFRLARDLLVNVTTVWQSDGHCLTFCFQRFEFTENGSRLTEW